MNIFRINNWNQKAGITCHPGSIAIATMFCFIMSCEDAPISRPTVPEASHVEGITAEHFGSVDNQEVILYTLVNNAGMTVKILNYGATISSIIVPDRDGQSGDVVLGFDSLSGYLQKNNPYFGALVGRYGNRIAHAQFDLDGKTYKLAANNGANTLHGGLRGFDKVVWNAKSLPGDSVISLRLEYTSKDGEEGFPGNLNAIVVYSLTPDNELRIQYKATTDKATPVNLTNHSYFNLSAGRDSTNLNQTLEIHASHFTQVNDDLIPTGKLPLVQSTPMDFTNAKTIGADINKVKGGYDHNYVLDKKGNELAMAVLAYDSSSGRRMEMLTTEPGVQFYTGNFLDGSLRGKQGKRYCRYAGFCLEAQHFPDSPNQPSFPSTILRPDEEYRQTTIYKFSTK
ncbi:MAG: aldose epimerase family protein [Chitinophagales bacterium]